MLSRQHSIPSRRCRIRDLSLERRSPLREAIYQSTSNYSSTLRAKPTQPPTVPVDYYGTISNRLGPGRGLTFHLYWTILSIHNQFKLSMTLALIHSIR